MIPLNYNVHGLLSLELSNVFDKIETNKNGVATGHQTLVLQNVWKCNTNKMFGWNKLKTFANDSISKSTLFCQLIFLWLMLELLGHGWLEPQ